MQQDIWLFTRYYLYDFRWIAHIQVNVARQDISQNELVIPVALRDISTDTAVVGRVGGEEFLVAEVVTTAVPHQLGQRLCDAVRFVPLPVTASVGTASVALSRVLTDDAAKQVYSRLGGRMRVAGTAEFARYDESVRKVRIDPLISGMKKLFPLAMIERLFIVGFSP